MIDHVSITVTDLDRAARFYGAVMAALGYPKVKHTETSLGYGVRRRADVDEGPYISVNRSDRVVPDRRHWAFVAPSRAAVEAFHAAALDNGGGDDGAPGLRTDYHAHYYGAFVTDPAGNRLEAVCHRPGPSP